MDRIKSMFRPRKVGEEEYAPLAEEDPALAGEDFLEGETSETEAPFSWIEYSIFVLIGVAMLWAW